MINNYKFNDVNILEISDSLISEMVLSFRKNGFLILNDIFDKKLIRAVHKHYISNYSSSFSEDYSNLAKPLSKSRFNVTINIKNEFSNPKIFANTLILKLLDKLFIEKYLISDMSCVTSMPGAPDMHIHRDGVIFEGNPLNTMLPPHAIGLLIPLIPFNKEVGVTRIWPGSHTANSKVGNYEIDSNYIDPILDIGSCLLTDYRIVHQGMKNISSQIRPLVFINYAAHWYFDQTTYKDQKPFILDSENYEKMTEFHKFLFMRKKFFE